MKKLGMALIAAAGCLLFLLSILLSPPLKAQMTPSGLGCNKAAIYDASTNGATQIVASGSAINICGFTMFAAGTVNVSLVKGTGTNCATAQVALTPAFQFTAQTGLVDPSPYYRGLNAPAGTALCVNASAGVAAQVIVYYSQNVP